MKVKITYSCCFCSNEYRQEIEVPDDWGEIGELDYELALCPDHSLIKDFIDAQCPGCVGGWGDCSLWREFAYTDRRDISEADMRTISNGICPWRTGGTMELDARRRPMRLKEINLSKKAPTESGEALVKAIHEYWTRYPGEVRK